MFLTHSILYGGNIMQVLKSRHKGIDFIQIYLTKEELNNEQIQEKIHKVKTSNAKVAVFVSGENEYLKILERIIIFEVEKKNVL